MPPHAPAAAPTEIARSPGNPPRIAVFYEHPAWFEAMFAELERRGAAVERWFAPEHSFDPSDASVDVDLVVNRMSPSAFTRGHGHAIAYTTELLGHLEAAGANVIHGASVYRYEFSKARQVALMARLGIRHPRSRVIHHATQAASAAEGLRFPLLVKPNVGGSGAGIRAFESREDLERASRDGDLDLGPDGIALVQERLRPRGDSIVRVEVLGGQFLYAIELQLAGSGSFNLCPADVCCVLDATGAPAEGRVPVKAAAPPPEVIDTVLRLTAAAGIEVGGVEYLIDDDTGEPVFYDINALSNFVSDAPTVVGFDPVPRLVDYLLLRAGRAQHAAAA